MNRNIDMSHKDEMTVNVLRHDPLVLRVQNFVSDTEISKILELGLPLLNQSQIQPRTAGRYTSARTSLTAPISGNLALDPVLVAINKRLSSFTGLNWRNVEQAQLVSYSAGDLHT